MRLISRIVLVIATLCLWVSAMGYPSNAYQKPWFTGPIENNANVMLHQHQWYVFPDVYRNRKPDFMRYGGYVQIAYGITDKWQVQIYPRYNYNTRDGLSSGDWGHTFLVLGYQVTDQESNSGLPSIKLNVKQILPTNRYDNFTLPKNIIESTGPAFYQTAFLLNTQYLSMPLPGHYMKTYFTIEYGYRPRKTVTGFNNYGGGFGTDGSMSGHQHYNMDLTFEYQFTQNWVGIFEWYYLYQGASTFSGNPGVNPNGTQATVFKEKRNQWSLFPTLEYNFDVHWGVLAGVWFSVNDKAHYFESVNLALNYIS